VRDEELGRARGHVAVGLDAGVPAIARECRGAAAADARCELVALVGSLDEALAEANAVDDGLTAGIFSPDEGEVEWFLDEIEAGGLRQPPRRSDDRRVARDPVFSADGKSSGSTGKGGLGPYDVQQFMREQSRTIVGE
jgi:1-pyrroline-5-carboxylate dehydrogenase